MFGRPTKTYFVQIIHLFLVCSTYIYVHVILFGIGNKTTAQKADQKQAAPTASASVAAQKPKDTRTGMFGPFPRGPKGLVERTPLIKHSPRRQDELQRIQSTDRNTTNAENQAFLKDVR